VTHKGGHKLVDFHNLIILVAMKVVYLLMGNCNLSSLGKIQLFKCFSPLWILDSINSQSTAIKLSENPVPGQQRPPSSERTVNSRQ
jgi:hypothetical protein